jgi:hypothetical protein
MVDEGREEMMAKQFGWFCACTAVLTLGGWIVYGAPGAMSCAKATCDNMYSCEESCSHGYESCRAQNNAVQAECTISYENCVRVCADIKQKQGGSR